AQHVGSTGVQFKLREPLHENSLLEVSVPGVSAGAPHVARTNVLQALQLPDPPKVTCDTPPLRDDREVFEASGYLGSAFDNFAQAAQDSSQDPGAHSRLLAGVETHYRLFGAKHDSFQVWLGGFTLHGVRSADVHCPGSSADASSSASASGGI